VTITVAELQVEVGADVSKGVAGLGKVDAAIGKTATQTGILAGKTSDLSKGVAGGLGFAAMFGTVGAVTAGVGALVDGIGASIDGASNLNETISKSGVVFGDSAAEVLAWSKTSADAMGQSQDQALAAAATYGNLFSTMGLGKAEAADMSTSLVGLASDLGSFNNVDPSIALDKLRAGLSGEAEPLRAMGVFLNEASVAAKAMELGLADSTDQLTEADKVQARYALIMEQTTTAQGDFARTSDGLANQQRINDAAMADLAATMGQALLPLMTGFAHLMNEAIIPGIRGIVTAIGQWAAENQPLLQALGTIAGIIGTVLVEAIKLAIQFISGWVNAISGGIGMIAGIVSAVIGFGQTVAGVAADVVGAFSTVIGGIGDMVASFLSIPTRIASVFVDVVGGFVNLAADVVGTVGTLIGDVVKWFMSIPGQIVALGGQIVGTIIDGLASLPGKLADAIGGAFRSIDINIGPFHISGRNGISIDMPDLSGIIPSFAVGTPNLPADMLAQVHRGEAILPEGLASDLRSLFGGDLRGLAMLASGGGPGPSVTNSRQNNITVQVIGGGQGSTTSDIVRGLRRLVSLDILD
jgi:hypothetical protein